MKFVLRKTKLGNTRLLVKKRKYKKIANYGCTQHHTKKKYMYCLLGWVILQVCWLHAVPLFFLFRDSNRPIFYCTLYHTFAIIFVFAKIFKFEKFEYYLFFCSIHTVYLIDFLEFLCPSLLLPLFHHPHGHG